MKNKCPVCKNEYYTSKRSNKQNNYLHAIFNTIADFQGDVSIEQVKEDVMEKLGCIEYKTNFITGKVRPYRLETHKMSTIDLIELTEKVRTFAREFFGLYIPDADEHKKGLAPFKLSST